MESLPLLQLSQTHLQILETCPRKFQYCFLDGLTLPQPSRAFEKQELGKQFHQLMQQRILGLEIQPLLDHNLQLQTWFHHFQVAPPPLIQGQSRQSEYQCTLALDEFTLISVFDLLIQSSTQAQIVDWKTYPRPPLPQLLQQHWQTQLYLFMATEALGYAPSQVSMVYWFAASPPASIDGNTSENWLSIPYTESMHQQTRQKLLMLLAALRGGMQAFSEQGQDFPQVPLTAKKCFSSQYSCEFVNQCHYTLNRPQADWEKLTHLEAIAEVPLELT